MLEKAGHTTRRGKSTNVQYARFADDMVILIDAERRSDWLVKAIDKRLREEFAKLRVAINEDKSRMVDLKKGESFTFLGFEYRRVLSLQRKWRPHYAPKLKKRTALFEKLREIFRTHLSWPVETVIAKVNPSEFRPTGTPPNRNTLQLTSPDNSRSLRCEKPLLLQTCC